MNEINRIYQKDLVFVCRLMVLGVIPHSKINGDKFIKKTDNILLAIQNPCHGCIPYGVYARLILCWIITEIVKKKSKDVILGKNLNDFIKKLKIQPDGRSYPRIKTQLTNLATSHFEFMFRNEAILQGKGSKIIAEYSFPWADKSNFHEFFVTIDDSFYQEIMEYPIPIDIKTLESLKESSVALDIYCWLSYRMFFLKKLTKIPIDKLQLQFGSEYANDFKGRYNFKQKFLVQLKKVLDTEPAFRVEFENDTLILRPKFICAA